jgi:hypothetical protein
LGGGSSKWQKRTPLCCDADRTRRACFAESIGLLVKHVLGRRFVVKAT